MDNDVFQAVSLAVSPTVAVLRNDQAKQLAVSRRHQGRTQEDESISRGTRVYRELSTASAQQM
jgi:hypothetical protein